VCKFSFNHLVTLLSVPCDVIELNHLVTLLSVLCVVIGWSKILISVYVKWANFHLIIRSHCFPSSVTSLDDVIRSHCFTNTVTSLDEVKVSFQSMCNGQSILETIWSHCFLFSVTSLDEAKVRNQICASATQSLQALKEIKLTNKE